MKPSQPSTDVLQNSGSLLPRQCRGLPNHRVVHIKNILSLNLRTYSAKQFVMKGSFLHKLIDEHGRGQTVSHQIYQIPMATPTVPKYTVRLILQ